MNKLWTPEQYDQLVSINVDIQNDFCPGGSLAVAEGDQVVEPMNRVNKYVRDLGGFVVFTRDWHPRVTSHFNTHGGPWPTHCVAYTAGAAFHEDLLVDTAAGDLIASKGMNPDRDDYSGMMAIVEGFEMYDRGGYDSNIKLSTFLSYGLEQAMHERNGKRKTKIERVGILVGGLATDYCVKATVLDLLALNKPGYDVYVLEDAIRAVDVNPGDGAKAIEEMKQMGAILINSRDVLAEHI